MPPDDFAAALSRPVADAANAQTLLGRHLRQLLPLRRLRFADAEVGKSLCGRALRPHNRSATTAWITLGALGLLRHRQQLAGFALGTEPDLALTLP